MCNGIDSEREMFMKRLCILILIAACAVGGASCRKQKQSVKPAVKTEKRVKTSKKRAAVRAPATKKVRTVKTPRVKKVANHNTVTPVVEQQ